MIPDEIEANAAKSSIVICTPIVVDRTSRSLLTLGAPFGGGPLAELRAIESDWAGNRAAQIPGCEKLRETNEMCWAVMYNIQSHCDAAHRISDIAC